jgi:hypothetical protein
MVTRFAASPPTDNCPQPKEAQPLSQLDIRLIQHFHSSALWFDGPEVELNWPFPYPIIYYLLGRTAMQKVRIGRPGFGTGRQKMALERETNPTPNFAACV